MGSGPKIEKGKSQIPDPSLEIIDETTDKLTNGKQRGYCTKLVILALTGLTLTPGIIMKVKLYMIIIIIKYMYWVQARK